MESLIHYFRIEIIASAGTPLHKMSIDCHVFKSSSVDVVLSIKDRLVGK